MNLKRKDEMLYTIQDLNCMRDELKDVLPPDEVRILNRCIDECKQRTIYNTIAEELGFDMRPLLK